MAKCGTFRIVKVQVWPICLQSASLAMFRTFRIFRVQAWPSTSSERKYGQVQNLQNLSNNLKQAGNSLV